MIKRKAPPPVEPMPGEAVEVARAVVATHYGGEVEAFEDILVDFQADPQGTVCGVRLDAPVGIGVELAAMTPWVLAAAGVVGGVVVDKAADSAYEAVRGWLNRVWARRRDGRSVEPSPRLADAEANQVTVMITVRLRGLGADEQIAHEVAERVVGELLVGELLVGGRPAQERTE